MLNAPSLKKNIVANYISQFYVALIGVALIPLYVRFMGEEAYGLIAFFMVIQTWFLFFDLGISPTITRQTASFNGGKCSASNLCQLLRFFEIIFVFIAMACVVSVICSANFISENWLNFENLCLNDVYLSLQLMGVIASLRLVSGLYRGVINGFEKQVWLSFFNIIISTLRFVFIIAIFFLIGTNVFVFFSYQLMVAVLEITVLIWKSYSILPKKFPNFFQSFSIPKFGDTLRFSLTVAFTGSVWILVTQTDKLLLSKLLTLNQYAYFSMAVLLANGLMTVSAPISNAVLPRMSRIFSENNEKELIATYRNATRLTMIIMFPIALLFILFPDKLLWTWTGDSEVVEQTSTILQLYSIGNVFLILSAFPYYLQFAKGNLRMHFYGNILFIFLIVPLLVAATLKFGVHGAGYVWMISNMLFFIFWVPFIHSYFASKIHLKWLFEDILSFVLAMIIVGFLIIYFINWPSGRLQVALILISITALFLLSGIISDSYCRNIIANKIRIKYAK